MDPSDAAEQATTPTADLDIGAAITRAAIAARAAAEREQQALQQVAELRAAYPGWDISRCRDETGEWWVAVLRSAVTEQMALLGVVRESRQRDGSALTIVLASQTALMERTRA